VTQLLDELIALTAGLLQREIVSARARGLLPQVADRFTGTYVPEELVAALAEPRAIDDATSAQIAAIEARIDLHFAAIVTALRGDPPAPLATLFQAFALSPSERRVLLVLIAFEASSDLRQLLRFLTNDAARVHPDVGILRALIYSDANGTGRLVRELGPDGVLLRMRLIETAGPRATGVPLLLRPVSVAPRVFELAAGVVRLAPSVASLATLVDGTGALALLHADKLTAEIDMLVRGAGRGPVPLLAGSDGSGRRSLLVRAAAACGQQALVVRSSLLPRDPETLEPVWIELCREAALFGALVVLEDLDHWLDQGDNAHSTLRMRVDGLLDRASVSIAATAGKSERRLITPTRGFVTVAVPAPDEGQRAILWKQALADSTDDALIAIAAGRYPVTAGVIHRAGTMVLAQSTPRGDAPTLADVHHGLRATMDVKLGGLGMRVQVSQRWDDLVLPEEALLEIREFIARVKHRRLVYETWGFDRKVARGLGLSALFSGPPGTGKTMVAGIIAGELGLDLYQVDLSRIVSKYVGETETNLANLFDAAESGHAVLLFDEADSLFAKRTDVKSSVDRYANLEVNYLLQRLEAFRGITILTTNFDTAIDEAFRRRLSLQVAFPVPEEDERKALWRALLPTEASVDADLDLDLLAERYAMTGGYIRNAVLRAAFLAADRGGAIGMDELVRACALEYASMGKVMSSSPSKR